MDSTTLYDAEIVEFPIKPKRIERPRKIKSVTFLTLFKRWMWIILLISSVAQCIFFGTADNIFAIISVLLGWWLTEVYLLRTFIVHKYSLSALLIFGYAFTQYCLPLIFTITEGKPLVYNLKFPYQVFFHSIAAFLILIAAHWVYANWYTHAGGLRKQIQLVMIKYKFFTPPSDTQIWIIGFIGLIAILAKHAAFGGGEAEGMNSEQGGAAGKFLEGFIPFMYAPFFIMMKSMYMKSSPRISKTLMYKMAFFTIALIAVGMLANSRGTFMKGITSLGITYLLGLLLGKFSYKIFKVKYIILGGAAMWIVTGPLADLGTAMVVVRGLRSTVSGSELFYQTLETYNNKAALEHYKKVTLENEFSSDWNEHYFDNIFLARFCNLKYNDASLEQSNKIGRIDPMIQQNSIDRFWSILPQPVLSALQINIDKKEVSASSFGDYLFMRAGGGSALGGFRTGHFAGTGMAAFGWWYLLLLGIGIIPLYFFLDLFVIWKKRGNLKKYRTYISLAGLTPITSYFMFLSLSSYSESVINIYTFLLRGCIQSLILYWLILYLSKKISYVLKVIL